MPFLLCFLLFIFISCSNSSPNNKNTSKNPDDTVTKADSHLDSILVDTPKILKAGKDYITRGTSVHDTLYFGHKFSPYKMEPYDIATLERELDSLIQSQKNKGAFKNKSLTTFKFEIFSVKTAKQKIQARVQAFCIEKLSKRIPNKSHYENEYGANCFFSIIYDLTDRKLISFKTNSRSL